MASYPYSSQFSKRGRWFCIKPLYPATYPKCHIELGPRQTVREQGMLITIRHRVRELKCGPQVALMSEQQVIFLAGGVTCGGIVLKKKLTAEDSFQD